MKNFNKLIIACDGESASGKSTAAKLISKKYNLLLVNSGLLYRYASKLIINHKPKNFISFLKKQFKNVSYKTISKQNLHSEKISNHVAVLAKNKKIRDIMIIINAGTVIHKPNILAEELESLSFGIKNLKYPFSYLILKSTNSL